MNPALFWMVVGISAGGAAGVLGAYVSWMRSKGTYTSRAATPVAVVTLMLAGALTAAVFKIASSWEHRVCLLLAPGFLIYWCVSQIREICSLQDSKSKGPGLKV